MYSIYVLCISVCMYAICICMHGKQHSRKTTSLSFIPMKYTLLLITTYTCVTESAAATAVSSLHIPYIVCISVCMYAICMGMVSSTQGRQPHYRLYL